MPCYHPLLRIENEHMYATAIDGHKYHPARIEKPDDINQRLEDLKNTPFYKKTIIPCRKCIGCRLDYSREWANRGYLEAKKSDNNYFVTLTYDDNYIYIPDTFISKNGITYTKTDDWNGTLIKDHFSKFIHDLRQIMDREQNHKGFKFLGCGEYGGKTNRPHYHVILFNIPLPSDTFYNSRLINKEFYFQNKYIERSWRYGISNITTATWSTIAYVSRYVTKKIYGTQAEEEYSSKGQIPEFIRMSKGIGRDYYENEKSNIYKNDEIIIKNRQGVHSTIPPKYFDKLYEKENPEKFNEIKNKRKKEIKDINKIKDKTFSMGRLEHLEIEERTHEEKHKKLKRHLECQTIKN